MPGFNNRPLGRFAFVSALILLGLLAVPRSGWSQNPRVPWEAEGSHPQHGIFSLLPWEQIDMLTGNVILRFGDITLPGINGVDLRIERVFNSNTHTWRIGPSGPAQLWLASPVHDNNPFVVNSDGSEEVGFRVPNTSTLHHTLNYAQVDTGARTLKTPDGLVWRFAEDTENANLKRVSSVEDAFGHTLLTYCYSEGRLARVYQDSGDLQRLLWIDYDGTSERISWAVRPADWSLPCPLPEDEPPLPTSRATWTYHWNSADLVSVIPPAGPGWAFDYSEPFVVKVVTPEGGEVRYRLEKKWYPFEGGLRQSEVVVVRQREVNGIQVAPATWTFDYIATNHTNVVWPLLDVGQPPRTDEYYHVSDDGSSIYAGRTFLASVRLGGAETTDYTWTPVSAVAPVGEDYQVCDNGVPPDCGYIWARPVLIESMRVRRTDNPLVFITRYDYRTGDDSDYNDYGHPSVITESGNFTRTTRLWYRHVFAKYVRGKVETVSIDGVGTVLACAYDETNGFLRTRTADGVTVTYTPNPLGQVKTENDGVRTTTFTYEAGVQKDVVTAAYTIARGIEPDGAVGWETRGPHPPTSFRRDEIGRLTALLPPTPEGPTRTTYSFDAANGAQVETKRCEVNDVDCTITRTTWLDGFGREVRSVSDGSIIRRATYDPWGRSSEEWLPYDALTPEMKVTRTFDPLGRVVRAEMTDGSAVAYHYASESVPGICPDTSPCLRVSVTQSRRPNVEAVTKRYFAATGSPERSRLVAVQDAKGNWTTYGYDNLDALVAVCGPNEGAPVAPCTEAVAIRRWVYDGTSHRMVSETHPESGETTYSYHPDGRLQTKTIRGRDGEPDQVHAFTYDANGRLRYDDFTSGGGAARRNTFDYNEFDLISYFDSGVVSTTYTYHNGRLPNARTDRVNGRSYTTQIEMTGYNHLGLPQKVIYPSGWCIRYWYDEDPEALPAPLASEYPDATFGHATSVWARDLEDRPIGFARRVKYHASGGLKEWVMGNQTFHQNTYDPRQRVETVTSGPLNLSYVYDDVGNVREADWGALGRQTFGYDALDRLTSVSGLANVTFEYNARGDRIGTSTSAAVINPTTFRLDSTTVGDVTRHFRYLSDGSLWKVWRDGGGPEYPDYRFAYNGGGLISSVDLPAKRISYEYDAAGLRILEQVKDLSTGAIESTKYFLHGWNGELLSEFAEENGRDVWTGDYIYLGGRLLTAVRGRDQRGICPSEPCPQDGDLPVPGDYRGDGAAELAVYRPATSTFWVRPAAGTQALPWMLGNPGDQPVVGDYDGDGLADAAVYRPATSTFWMRPTNGAPVIGWIFGDPGDHPVVGDYDGDGQTDVAVRRAATFWARRSSDGEVVGWVFGNPDDIPVVGDYDGDGRADVAVYRPSTSTFWVRRSSDGAVAGWVFGNPGDEPLVGDYDGDHRTDIAVYQAGTRMVWAAPSSGAPVIGWHFPVAGIEALVASVPSAVARDNVPVPKVAPAGLAPSCREATDGKPPALRVSPDATKSLSLASLPQGADSAAVSSSPGTERLTVADFDADGRDTPALVGTGTWLIGITGGSTVAQEWPLPAEGPSSDDVEYYHLDALGSVRAVTGQSGATVIGSDGRERRHDFFPFGVEYDGPVYRERLLFTGKERDQETGLDYFGARYYRADIGRFTTIDPVYTWQENLVDPQRWNRYAYARNNPLKYVDPDGRAIDTIFDIASIAYDLFKIAREGATRTNVLALGADVGAAVIPFATGAGAAVRAARGAERVVVNAERGRAFERAALEALDVAKNSTAVKGASRTGEIGRSIPDALKSGITEIKDVQKIYFTRQLQIQYDAAAGAGVHWNLVVGPNTQHIAAEVQNRVLRTGGTIQMFDPVRGVFRPWVP